MKNKQNISSENKYSMSFRYNDIEKEQIKLIYNYIEKEFPGIGKNKSDAIRYALAYTARNIMVELEKSPS